MKALLVKGVFHWGFSVRIVTESAGAQQYLLPPPSTLTGALSYGLSISKALSECITKKGKKVKLFSRVVKLADAIKWATFAFSDEASIDGHAAAIGYSDFIRSFRLIYQRGARHSWEQQDMWYGVSAHGKVYACGTGFKTVYIVDEQKLKELGFRDEDLLIAAFSIVRIGAREGLVSILDVNLSNRIEIVRSFFIRGHQQFLHPHRACRVT